jgi:M6 family metalloprotease-like protein
MRSRYGVFAACVALVALGLASVGLKADVSPDDGAMPDAYHYRKARDPRAFTFKSGFKPLVDTVRSNRDAVFKGELTRAAADSRPGGVSVRGNRNVPVLAVRYANSPRPNDKTLIDKTPIDLTALEARLFGPDAKTMRAFYLENSFGALKVSGTVKGYFDLPRNDDYYEGADFLFSPGQMRKCHGMCGNAKTGEMIQVALAAAEAGGLDFSRYDNDGPDGVPNSGDDNGKVDFVAIVQPEHAGECSATGGRNIWSHRYSLTGGWRLPAYRTSKTTVAGPSGPAGRPIEVDDYVIMPALACDTTTPIQIGVFAHEFGHAFNLPDLYDNDPRNGKSAGVGNWCLMGSGSWGGDNVSPDLPAHMSAWAKTYLGWVEPVPLQGTLTSAVIKATMDSRSAVYKLPISANKYYLLEYRPRRSFDAKLHNEGLLVWRIDDDIIQKTIDQNQVNDDENNPGVKLIEADGESNLKNTENPCGTPRVAGCGNRGDAGDPFPGTAGRRAFDVASTPRVEGKLAVCAISAPGTTMTATLQLSNRCPPSGPNTARIINPPVGVIIGLGVVAGAMRMKRRRA